MAGEICTIEEILDFNPRTTLPKTGKVPFIDMAALPTAGRDIYNVGTRDVSSSGSKFQNGDTLLARITPCLENGKGAKVSGLLDHSVGQGSTEFIVMRAKDTRDENFIYYLSRHPDFRTFAIQQMSGTSGRQRVGWQSLIDYPIPLLDVGVRQKIGCILSALDDKIELNRRMNETLEAQAQALFRDWFVDFGPVKAKMANRITANTKQASTRDAGAAIQAPYLADEIWSLFPSALDDDGKPEGWSDYRVEELADYRKGSVNPANEPDVIFEHYSLPAYDTREEPALDFGATIKSNKTLVPEGAILLSKLNPETPRVWIPDRPTGRTQVASTEFLAFVPKQGVGTALVYSLFNETAFRQTLAGMVTGTSKSHQRILPGALIKMAALSGAPQLFGAFENLVAPILSQILANRYQSRTLAQTRDLLLPKLMSGEIRVAQAAREIEAVL